MRLLIITQKVDTNDLILGFFHEWIAEFATKFKAVVVICLFKGKFDLPDNVAVLSLGKEKWRSKLKYIFLLFYFSLRYFNRYDAVLVHMNEEYVVLAGWLWRLMGKKVFMWRNHHIGNRMTDVASIFCNKVFCTSKYSYTAKYKKTVLMPVGVNMDMLASVAPVPRQARSILSHGRVDPSKNIHIFVEALGLLKKQNVPFTADIYGNPSSRSEAYLNNLKTRSLELGLENVLTFHPGVQIQHMGPIYGSHQIFVNLSPSGMYDKTIFEAMTCGCLTLVSNDNLKGGIDDRLIVEKREPEAVAQQLKAILSLSEKDAQQIIKQEQEFAAGHSLRHLAEKLCTEMK
jgi:glycosyltransferase involved in cell wall biosynthesis